MPDSLKSAKLLRPPVLWLGGGLLAALLLALVLAVLPRGTRRPAPGPAQDQQEAALREAVRAAPEDPRPRVQLTQYLLAVGRRNDALGLAREARLIFPESVPVQATLAAALVDTSRVPEAVATIRPLAKLDPEYRIQLASYLIRDGKREEAARVMRDAGAVRADLCLRAGLVYLDLFRPEQAVPLFRRASALSGASDREWSHLGFALILAGRYREAVEPLHRALAAAPQVPTLYYYLGSALRLSGDLSRLPEAEEHLRRATELAPQDGLFYYELALSRVQLRDFQAARASLERAAELSPQLPEVQRDLARIYERTADPQEAAVARSRYLRLLDDPGAAARVIAPVRQRNSRDAELIRSLAAAYFDSRRNSEALALLSAVRTREPNNTRVLWDLYGMHDALQNNEQALQVLDALAAGAPADPNVVKARADMLLRLQRFSEAERELTRLRDMEPTNPARHYDLGVFTLLWSDRADRLQAAEASFRKTLELDPSHKGAHSQLGQVLQRSGRTAEGVAHLRRSVDLDPAYTDAYRLLGQAYALLGDSSRSKDAFGMSRRLQAQEAEQRRLELPGEQERATPGTRLRLASYYTARGQLSRAIRELEVLAHLAPGDREASRLLVQLYGSARRFQRQFEEREAARGAGR